MKRVFSIIILLISAKIYSFNIIKDSPKNKVFYRHFHSGIATNLKNLCIEEVEKFQQNLSILDKCQELLE